MYCSFDNKNSTPAYFIVLSWYEAELLVNKQFLKFNAATLIPKCSLV